MYKIFFIFLVGLITTSSTQSIDYDAEKEPQNQFTPTLTASCLQSKNSMVITLTTLEPFYGIVLSSNQRNNSNCYKEGDGSTQTILSLNMQASIKDKDYCGVSINYKSSEKTAQISIRQNKILELADDKNYLVSCGKFDSPAPLSSKQLHLALYDSNNNEALEVVKTHAYKIKIKTKKEGNFRVRNCFAFSGSTNTLPLTDANGCPESKIISRWSLSENGAEATIYSMFRFQDSKTLTFQCHVLFCDNCPNPTCSETPSYLFSSSSPSKLIGSNDTDAIASSTVTVLEPGEKLQPYTLGSDPDVCTGRFCPTWLLWLCILLGVLFILMLLVNLFLCTALTCTCTRTELIEKEPSIDNYDPYRSSYFSGGSQYNSRYSINAPKAYSDMSDHYATPGTTTNLKQRELESRPNSRY